MLAQWFSPTYYLTECLCIFKFIYFFFVLNFLNICATWWTESQLCASTAQNIIISITIEAVALHFVHTQHLFTIIVCYICIVTYILYDTFGITTNSLKSIQLLGEFLIENIKTRFFFVIHSFIHSHHDFCSLYFQMQDGYFFLIKQSGKRLLLNAFNHILYEF